MANENILKQSYSSLRCEGRNLPKQYGNRCALFQHASNWLIRFWMLSAIIVTSFCSQGRGAEKIQGVTVYEVFDSGGLSLMKVEESFDAIIEGKHWLINTRLLTLTPPSNSDQVFCPPSQEVGSDGIDLFYLKSMRVGGTNMLVGWVEPGVMPNVAQSPTVVILWLAYCSGSYFGSETKYASPVWVGSSNNKNRQQKCQMSVFFEKREEASPFLKTIHYANDGRSNPCEEKTAKNNLLPPPWNGGFTQGVYKVETSFASRVTMDWLPSVFRFDVFMPKGKPGGSEITLRVSSSISAIATNVISGIQVSNWLPKLPVGLKVGVYDYRFTDVVTNWDAVSYIAKDAWRSTVDKEVELSVKMHSAKATNANKQSLPATKFRYVRLSLLIILGLPVAIMVSLYVLKKQNKNN